MNRLALISLAASALVPIAAPAQTTVQPPVKWEDSPNAKLRVPAASAPVARPAPAPAPGVSWQRPPAPAPVPPVQRRVQAPPPMPHVQPPRVAPPPVVRVAPGDHVQSRRHEAPPAMQHGEPEGPVRFHMRRRVDAPAMHEGNADMRRDVIIHRRGDRMVRRHHGINRYPHYRRIDRGVALPQYWWGPRFHVRNWGMYGLPQPMHGGRWVRYYDDALLVDSYGRVHDGRWGMQWDEYGDRWDYDDRGIPVYGDHGDYREERYSDWAEGPHGPAYGYGHHQQGYGYPGYGYGGGMVVTETTVTTSPTVIRETVYEDVVHSAPKRKYRSKGRRIASKTRCVC